MPANESRKYTQVIDLLEDQVGADIPRDVLKVAVQEIDDPAQTNALPTDLQKIAGTDQTAADLMAMLESTSTTDEIRARHYGVDNAGNLLESQVENLNDSVASNTVAQITYLSRALNSQDLDEFISRVTDSTGTQIDPMTTDPLQDVANDELRSRLFGPDNADTLQQVNAEAFDTALAATDIGLATYVARSLQSQSQDELRSRVFDSNGNNIDPATAALENALKSEDTDELIARIAGADGIEVQEETLDTAVTTASTGLLTYLSRALASVGQDELQVDLQASGIQVPTDQQDALEKSAINYGHAIETNQTIQVQVDGYSVVEVFFNNATTATDITVERSWDNTNWEEEESQTGVTNYNQTFTSVTAKHVRISITGTGNAGDTADVVLGAVP